MFFRYTDGVVVSGGPRYQLNARVWVLRGDGLVNLEEEIQAKSFIPGLLTMEHKDEHRRQEVEVAGRLAV